MMIKYFEINDRGNNIKCKLFCEDPQNIKTVILSCHGFAGSKEGGAIKRMAETFIKKDKSAAMIAFDWPCHGKDVRKNLTLEDCDSYMDCVVRFIQENMGVDNIFLQATSFGGYLSLKYVSEHPNPFKKIALRCPAVKMYDLLMQKVLTDEDKKDLAKGRPVVSGFERKIRLTPEFLGELQANDITKRDFSDYCGTIRVMQGTNDELVNFEDVREFCDNNILDFDPIEGADHRYTNPAHLRACINIMEELYAPSEIELGRGLN